MKPGQRHYFLTLTRRYLDLLEGELRNQGPSEPTPEPEPVAPVTNGNGHRQVAAAAERRCSYCNETYMHTDADQRDCSALCKDAERSDRRDARRALPTGSWAGPEG
jgi:hypothetical protein